MELHSRITHKRNYELIDSERNKIKGKNAISASLSEKKRKRTTESAKGTSPTLEVHLS